MEFELKEIGKFEKQRKNKPDSNKEIGNMQNEPIEPRFETKDDFRTRTTHKLPMSKFW